MMILDRRRFLSTLFGAAAASTTAYFLPPIGGWHSDVIANPGAITMKMLEDAFAQFTQPNVIFQPKEYSENVPIEEYEYDFWYDSPLTDPWGKTGTLRVYRKVRGNTVIAETKTWQEPQVLYWSKPPGDPEIFS